jgi:hypothetical protein
MNFSPNMVSGVNITPNTSPAVNILANYGQQKQHIDQMKLAEMGRNKAYLQDMISKSFANVSGNDREKYKEMQDEFITKAGEVWKGSGGFLSMDDTMKLQALKQPIDNYVAMYNDVRNEYSDAVQKIVSADPTKVDREKSYSVLDEIMKSDNLEDKWSKLNSGAWYQRIPEKFDLLSYGKKARDVVKTPIDPEMGTDTDIYGNVVAKSGYKINDDKLDLVAQSYWDKDPAVKRNYNSFAQWKEDLRQSIPNLLKTSLKDDPDAKNEEIDPVQSEDGNRWDLKAPMKYTIVPNTVVYDSSGEPIKTKDGKENIPVDGASEAKVTAVLNINGKPHMEVLAKIEKGRLEEMRGRFTSETRIFEDGKITVYIPLNEATYKNKFGKIKLNEFNYFDGNKNGNTRSKKLGDTKELGL